MIKKLKVRILGTMGEVLTRLPGHRRHSGILVDDRLLFDIGEPSYLKFRPEAIFITHLHPDHAFFAHSRNKIDFGIPVFLPEKAGMVKNARIIKRKTTFGNYKITPIPTIHSLKVASQGYIIERMGKRVFYTSDLITIEKKYHPLLHGLDAVITEASFIRKGGLVRTQITTGICFGHAGVPELSRFFSKFTLRIIFTHFGTWFLNDPKASAARLKSVIPRKVKASIARDGSEYII